MDIMEGFKNGINLGGWLSQCDHTKQRYESFISEADVEVIGRWGLDHLRLPVDYDLVETRAGGCSYGRCQGQGTGRTQNHFINLKFCSFTNIY